MSFEEICVKMSLLRGSNESLTKAPGFQTGVRLSDAL